MKQPMLDAKGERMLELLAQGASNGLVAKRMGYTEGTMRVYLCHLYRKLGVANKTEAVVWYLGRARDRERAEEAAPRGLPEDLFGAMALEEGLYAALGVMSRFVGPHGRMWEVAMRLRGEEIDAEMHARRERSRALWGALLRGDWASGKRIYDEDQGDTLLVDSPSDAVLLAALLQAGGYSTAAERLTTRLLRRRKAGPGASPREAGLIESLHEALEGDRARGLAALQKLAGDKAASPVLRQAATALVFHAAKARKDIDRARLAANAMWVEAEAARHELQAMGERPLGVGAREGADAKARGRAPAERALEKAAAR